MNSSLLISSNFICFSLVFDISDHVPFFCANYVLKITVMLFGFKFSCYVSGTALQFSGSQILPDLSHLLLPLSVLFTWYFNNSTDKCFLNLHSDSLCVDLETFVSTSIIMWVTQATQFNVCKAELLSFILFYLLIKGTPNLASLVAWKPRNQNSSFSVPHTANE